MRLSEAEINLDLSPLAWERLTEGTKGLPAGAVGFSLHDLPSGKWDALRDVPTPFAVLKRSALDHNRRLMSEFVRAAGVRLAPHGKTTMAPQLFALQAQDGAWAFTAATLAHLAVYRRFGVRRVIFANQLVDRNAIDWVLDALESDPAFDFYALIDTCEGVEILAEALASRKLKRPLQLLLEVGARGGRTGVRTVAAAMDVSAAVAKVPQLALRGVEAFEGIFGGSFSENSSQVSELFDDLVSTANALSANGAFSVDRPLITAGGSVFFERAASELRAGLDFDADIVLRSGCYLTDDHGFYAASRAAMGAPASDAPRLSDKLQPALEVWGHVLSRPEPGLIFLNIGKRDISHDIDLPIPLSWLPADVPLPARTLPPQVAVLRLNDQHACLQVPHDLPIAPGDRVALGCSHPCTTFDKWSHLLMVDDNYAIEQVVRTYF